MGRCRNEKDAKRGSSIETSWCFSQIHPTFIFPLFLTIDASKKEGMRSSTSCLNFFFFLMNNTINSILRIHLPKNATNDTIIYCPNKNDNSPIKSAFLLDQESKFTNTLRIANNSFLRKRRNGSIYGSSKHRKDWN